MKVRCSLCGKKYELEYNGASCPKCGQRNYNGDTKVDSAAMFKEEYTSHGKYSSEKDSQHHSEIHKQYDEGGHHVSQPEEFSSHYDTKPQQSGSSHTEESENGTHIQPTSISVRPSARGYSSSTADISSLLMTIKKDYNKDIKNKVQKKPSGCCLFYFTATILIIMIIFVALLPFIYKNGTDEKGEKNISKETYYETINYIYYVETENQILMLSDLSDIFKEYVSWNIPEGFEMVVYAFEYQAEEDNYYGYFEEGDLLEIYAVTKDGRYIEPIASFEAEEIITDDPYQQSDLVVSDLGYQYGYLCFLVEEDNMDYIMIDEYKEANDSRKIITRHILE